MDAEVVSVLIPARNEQHNIYRLLDSILLQKGVVYEIFVLDDHSTDHTRLIVEKYAAVHNCIKLLSGAPLPPGWTGKNYACHQLAQAASGKYLVFLDADVELHPEVLASSIFRMRQKKLSLLSLFADQETLTFAEQVTVPLMNYLLLTLLPLRLIESHKFPIFSAACGQFMLFNSEDYLSNQWHQRARDKVVEDLTIMKMVKQNGLRGEGLMAGGLMKCRMYFDYMAAIMGFSKNFIAPFNDHIPVFLAFIAALILGPVLILVSGNLFLIIGYIVLVIASRYFTSKLSGRLAATDIVYHPIQMASLLTIAGLALYWKCTKSVQWKGRTIVVKAG